MCWCDFRISQDASDPLRLPTLDQSVGCMLATAPCSTSWLEAMRWAPPALERIARSDFFGNSGAGYIYQYGRSRTIRVSTSFSGVLTPELSLRMWCAASNAFCTSHDPHHSGMLLRSVFAIEKSKQCQDHRPIQSYAYIVICHRCMTLQCHVVA
jgi:hypothetical protein